MTRLLLLMFGLTAGAELAAAQQPPPPPVQPAVFRSATNIVTVNVTVTDGRKPITGLTRGDFQVLEDGVPQEVQFFESRTVPLDVILLLDTSSSMQDKMPAVHEAARSFMKILRPEDRGAVVTFADSVQIVQELTHDGRAIEAAINGTQARGSTALRTAVYVALKQFALRPRAPGEIRRQAIAVLSDGQDTKSLVPMEDVLALARRSGVNIYPIALAITPRDGREPDNLRFSDAYQALQTLARETGGQVFVAAHVHGLKDIYQTIAGELSAQYSIAYSPTNARADGRFRKILIRIISNPTLRPRARAGYTADGK